MRMRVFASLLLAAGTCWGKADTAVTARLVAEFKEAHPYVPAAATTEQPAAAVEPVLQLEPMVVTSSRAFAVDILAEARRAAAARAAEKFSLVKGGSLLSFRRGDLGFWPEIVPIMVGPGHPHASPVKKGDVAIKVDLLRIKW